MSFFKRLRSPFLLLVILFLVVSFGQTLFMYFWQDDSALIFKLQNPVGQAGSFGVGIWQRGAYQYLVPPFVPFFPLFGLEPFGYYLVGFLTYGLATLAFYFFAKELFDKKFVIQVSTLLFAAGYVGSDTMFRVINSWQTNAGLILSLITLTISVKYLKKRSLKLYLLSVLFYFLTIELVFIRSHSLIFPIIFLDFIYSFFPFELKKTFYFVLRQVPFLLLFKFWYLADENFGSSGLSALMANIIAGKFETLTPFFANVGNGLFSHQIQNKIISIIQAFEFDEIYTVGLLGIITIGVSLLLYLALSQSKKFFSRDRIILLVLLLAGVLSGVYFYFLDLLYFVDINSLFAYFIGLNLSIVIVFWAILNFKKQKVVSLALLIGLAIVASQIFGYFTQYPTAIFNTTHRYFSYSLIGYALVYGSLVGIIMKRKKLLAISLFLFLSVSNLVMGFAYQNQILRERSIPSRKFYQDLLSAAPDVSKGAIFYFDVINDAFYQRQFGDFFSVGSMPETTALAVYYNLDRYDLAMVSDFDELAYKIDSGQHSIDQVYSFYYGPEGLVDTTAQMRQLLEEGSSKTTSPISPMLVTAEIDINIIPTSEFLKSETNSLETSQKIKILEYLADKKNYYDLVTATSSSDWKFREVRQIIDGDPGTPWQGHRIWWGDHQKEEVLIDQRKLRRIGAIAWLNWNQNLSPTSYKILASSDAKTWQEIVRVEDSAPRNNGEVVIERFAPVNARYLQMIITKTATDDSPAILEFEAIDDKFTNIDLTVAHKFGSDPFSSVSSLEEWQALLRAIKPIATVQASWVTDKKSVYNNTMEIPIDIAKKSQSIEFVIPAGGTKIEKIEFNSNIPMTIETKNITTKNLSIDELKKRNLIKEFKEN